MTLNPISTRKLKSEPEPEPDPTRHNHTLTRTNPTFGSGRVGSGSGRVGFGLGMYTSILTFEHPSSITAPTFKRLYHIFDNFGRPLQRLITTIHKKIYNYGYLHFEKQQFENVDFDWLKTLFL